MGKKNKKTSKHDFNRGLMSEFYGPGKEARKMLDRYDVEGYRPGGRAQEMTGKSYRSVDQVRDDLAKAMMADPNTVMSMHYGADVSKDAKKYAKKGFSSKNIQGAWETLKDLKKEHVGGGGMDGPENIMGLTYALKKASRDAFAAELASREPKMVLDDDGKPNYVENPYEDEPEGLDPFVRDTRDRVDEWIRDGSGRTGRGYAGVFPLGRYDGQKGEIVPSPGNEGLDATEERIVDGPSFASNFKRQIMNEIRQASGYGDEYV